VEYRGRDGERDKVREEEERVSEIYIVLYGERYGKREW
jgi:hypothetical protein